MNLVQLTILKAEKENSHKGNFSEEHTKVLQSLIMHGELYLDELAELLEMDENKIKNIIEDLIEMNLVEWNMPKYRVIEPFYALDFFIQSRKKQKNKNSLCVNSN